MEATKRVIRFAIVMFAIVAAHASGQEIVLNPGEVLLSVNGQPVASQAMQSQRPSIGSNALTADARAMLLCD